MVRHPCPNCDAVFGTKAELAKHLRKKNPCNKGFPCNLCGKNSKTAETRRKHQKKCTGPKKIERIEDVQAELDAVRKQLAAQTIVIQQAEQHPIADEASASSSEEPSQPPVEFAPAIIEQPDFFDFEGKHIRKTSETPERISVHDLIVAITDQSTDSARKKFSLLKKSHPEVEAFCLGYKFPGGGQQDTPVTDAKGAVLIMNALSGKKAAAFRLASADIIVRYLGGDETLIKDIKRNQAIQETASETNPVRFFGNAVASVADFHETSSLELESATGFVAFRAPSIYLRQVHDRVSNLHPVGRPQDVLTPEQLAEVAIVKIGSQGGYTGRQVTHEKKNYNQSKLLDSKLTTSFTHVETQAKDVWRNNGDLYEGLFEGKTTRDTELLLVRDQEDYERQVLFYHGLCPVENTSLDLQLAQEKSRQTEADVDARKAEAEARKVEAEADARKAEAEASARKAEAEANARIAEANLRQKELDFEMMKRKFQIE